MQQLSLRHWNFFQRFSALLLRFGARQALPLVWPRSRALPVPTSPRPRWRARGSSLVLAGVLPAAIGGTEIVRRTQRARLGLRPSWDITVFAGAVSDDCDSTEF